MPKSVTTPSESMPPWFPPHLYLPWYPSPYHYPYATPPAPPRRRVHRRSHIPLPQSNQFASAQQKPRTKTLKTINQPDQDMKGQSAIFCPTLTKKYPKMQKEMRSGLREEMGEEMVTGTMMMRMKIRVEIAPKKVKRKVTPLKQIPRILVAQHPMRVWLAPGVLTEGPPSPSTRITVSPLRLERLVRLSTWQQSGIW